MREEEIPISFYQDILDRPTETPIKPKTNGHAKPTEGEPLITAHPIDWPALEGKMPPERDWAIHGWLGMGHATLLAGPGSIGKTLLAQTVASYLALGQSFIGQIDQPRRVLMWACEDDHDELWRRQLAIGAHMGQNLIAYAENLTVVPRSGLENTLLANHYGQATWTPLIGELTEQVNDLRADILILDNVRQLCANELDGHFVTRFVNAFSGLRHNMATVLLAHPAKGIGSEFSGNAAWENACRMRWYLGNKLPDHPAGDDDDPDSDVRYLYKRKTNYSAKDYLKLDYSEGVLIPQQVDIGVPMGDRFKAELAERIVISAMAKLTSMGKVPTDGKTSPDYLPRLVKEYGLQEGMQTKDLTGAMRNLMLSGKLKRQVAGTYANRTPKMGLVCT